MSERREFTPPPQPEEPSQEKYAQEVEEQYERLKEIWEIKPETKGETIIVKGEERTLKSVVRFYFAEIDLSRERQKALKEGKRDVRTQEELREAELFAKARLEALDKILNEEVGRTYGEILCLRSFMVKEFPHGTPVRVKRKGGKIEDGWQIDDFLGPTDKVLESEFNYSIRVIHKGQDLIKWIAPRDVPDFLKLNNLSG